VTLVSLISDLRLRDLNSLVSVKPTPQRQGRNGLLMIAKQTFAINTDGRLKTTQSRRPKKKPLNEWLFSSLAFY